MCDKWYTTTSITLIPFGYFQFGYSLAMDLLEPFIGNLQQVQHLHVIVSVFSFPFQVPGNLQLPGVPLSLIVEPGEIFAFHGN